MATVCPTVKIDSNVTGLRIAEEVCLKVLPTIASDGHDPIWQPYEPNSYSDTGGSITTVARDPINPSRQRKKGVVTDLDAKAGFQSDMTQNNVSNLMQGFCFAAARQRVTTAPMYPAASTAITDVTTATKVYATTKVGFKVGDIVLASGFSVAANNGLKTVASIAAGEVVVNEAVVDEVAPPASASLSVIGFTFPADDVSVVMSGNLARLTSAATDMTSLGIVPGEWIFVGGDLSTSTLATNKGFARVGAITATYLEFDKTAWAPVAEAGAGKSISVYLGTVIKNEDDPSLIVRKTYQFERTLGNDADGVQSQYVTGCVANEFTMNIAQASKVTMDMAFVACDSEARTGAQGLKTGTRPALVDSDAFNTSSDFSRIALAVVDPATSNPVPLVAFCTDASLTIKNNASGAKAVGVLGNFEMTIGTFDVGGSLTAYFQNVSSIQAVRNNADITLDMILVKNNAGLVLDIPLLSLGNGMPAVEKDKPITIPLDSTAAQSHFGHTLLYVNFPYLPNAADL